MGVGRSRLAEGPVRSQHLKRESHLRNRPVAMSTEKLPLTEGFLTTCRKIWQREFRDDLVSFRLLALAFILGVAFFSSIYISAKNFATNQEKYAQYLTKEPKLGFLYRPPDPLNIFAYGASQTTAAPSRRGAIWGEPESEPLPADHNPINLFVSKEDYLQVSQILLALCALLLSYSTISRERESGTLRLMLSRPIPRSAIYFGKLLRGVTLLFLPLLIAFLSCLPVVYLYTGSMDQEQLVIITLILMISFIYSIVFYAAGLVISAFIRSSKLCIVVAVMVWIGSTLILPTTAPVLAGVIAPAPTRAELATMQNDARNRFLGAQEMRKIFFEQTVNFADARKKAINEMNRVTDEYIAKVESQAGVTANIERLSPTGCYALAMTSLTGTSLADQSHYLSAVRAGIRNYVLDNAGQPSAMTVRLTAAERFQNASLDILLLVLYIAVLATTGYIRFLYYDPR
jgi:ABC-type transport system involved in multi-copper enzyme maturation permease subunit